MAVVVVVVYYCRTYYKAVRVGRTYYKAVRVGVIIGTFVFWTGN
jgi:hypothetical protein